MYKQKEINMKLVHFQMIQNERKLNVWFYISYKVIIYYSATIYCNIVYLKLNRDFLWHAVYFDYAHSYGYALITLLFFTLNNVKHTQKMAIKCRFRSTLHLPSETCCVPTNIEKVTVGI